MKPFRPVLIVALLVSGTAFAQSTMPARAPSMVMAGQAATAPGHAAAVLALQRFTDEVQARHALPSILAASSAVGARRGNRPGAATAVPVAGFPLAVHSLADLQQAQIGWGVAVYAANPRELLAGRSLAASTHPTGEWRYAITLQGRPIGMVTLVHAANDWQAVSFGGAELSRDMDALIRRYHGAGVNLRYVQLPQAEASFMEIQQRGAQPAFATLGVAKSGVRIAAVPAPRAGAKLLPGLREAIRRNLATTH